MKTVAVVASVWLHVLVLGGLVLQGELLRIEKLPVPAEAIPAAARPGPGASEHGMACADPVARGSVGRTWSSRKK